MSPTVLLVERETELATLAHRYAEAERGRGGVVVVCGLVATGKSVLLDTFAGQVTGATVLTAVGSAAESGLPLGVVSQLFASAGLDRPDPATDPAAQIWAC